MVDSYGHCVSTWLISMVFLIVAVKKIDIYICLIYRSPLFVCAKHSRVQMLSRARGHFGKD